MTIETQLMEDMKTAMKSHQMEDLQVIRFLRSAIKNAQIDGAGSDDADLQKIIASQVKKSKEAVAEFIQAGRDDLAEEEKAKIKVMEKYLPAQLADADLQKIIQDVLAARSDETNTGKLIGQVMKQVASQADGARVKDMVNQLINNK